MPAALSLDEPTFHITLGCRPLFTRDSQIRSLASWEYRQKPHPRRAEDFNEVFPVAIVEFRMRDIEAMANEPISVVFLLTQFDGSHIVQGQVHVEGEEHAERNEKEHADQVDDQHYKIFEQERGSVHDGSEGVDQTACHSSKNKAQASNCIEKKEKEKFVVSMANAVRNPWAMVIHS
eukprot:CAMPEP_0170169014 /NCGR_PEP_ID=MMETSP0040_2-20121228/1941_1 /TAXON_ID=641309 /ORGANISM="Lotharella oceanica, Strain CCMP622" /LENGTH=176 /DNA_ID=CAMNT_0010407495 /DNA_START=204 /DNA_END=734 /DNA_ORIENTATION=+